MAQNGGIDDAIVFVVLDEEDGLPVRSHACPHAASERSDNTVPTGVGERSMFVGLHGLH
jgi:hypothetical protein